MSSYHQSVLAVSKVKRSLKDTVLRINEIRASYPFEAIASTGISGNGLNFLLSYTLDIPAIIVRKDGEEHHGYMVEHDIPHERITKAACLLSPQPIRYIIVDDFIGCGNTVKRIRRMVEEHILRYKIIPPENGPPPARSVCVAIMLYARYKESAGPNPEDFFGADRIPVFKSSVLG